MKNKIFFELYDNLSTEEYGRAKYTGKAYNMIPKIQKPKILDIGCGSGKQTVFLAKISKGNVTGIDIHQPYLDKLKLNAKKANLSHKIKALNCSMFEMNFPEESFDIIWAEGSIYAIGFEKGLSEWKKFIKPKGYLAIHEMTWIKDNPPDEIRNYWEKLYSGITTIEKNIDIINKCNYKSIGHFSLPEDTWWIEYYNPLEKRIQMLKKKYNDNPSTINVLDKEQEEVDLYKKYSKWYGSAFFVMQKI